MRVLLAIDALDTLGGSERHARELAPVLAERGHEVRFLVERPHRGPADGAPLHVAPLPEDAARVARHLAPDVVHVLGAREPRRVRALASAAPVVRFVQDHVPFCPGLNKLVRAGAPCTEPAGLACLRRAFLEGGCACLAADEGLGVVLHRLGATLRGLGTLAELRGVVVASDYMRAQLAQAGLATERVHTIPYFTLAASRALAPEPLPPETEEYVARHRGRLLLAAARLVSPDTGVEFLLTALGKLRRDAALVVAGDGPSRAWLERKARDEGLGARVHFAGALSSGRMETLYPRCEAVAFPSVWDEPFGLVGIEAMAHARPVAAFDVGGVREWLVPGATGLLAPRRDADALADALDRLLGDAALRLRLGRAGAARVEERFRPAHHAELLERALSG